MNGFPLNFKMAAQVWILNEIVELSAVEEEDLFISEDGDQALTLAAVSTYMRRDLNRSEGFSENIVPRYSIDEFTSHFRTGATLEALCREVQATGRVPQCHSYRRPPIPLEKQVLAFVWFIAKSEVVRSVYDTFDETLSRLNRTILRVSGACVNLRNEYIRWPTVRCRYVY